MFSVFRLYSHYNNIIIFPWFSHVPMIFHSIPIDSLYIPMIFPLICDQLAFYRWFSRKKKKNIVLMPRKFWSKLHPISGACRWRQRRRWDDSRVTWISRHSNVTDVETWSHDEPCIDLISWYSLIKNGEKLGFNEEWWFHGIKIAIKDIFFLWLTSRKWRPPTTDSLFFIFANHPMFNYHTIPHDYMTSPWFVGYVSWDPHVCSHRPMENMLFWWQH
jgi:hypothetical protein